MINNISSLTISSATRSLLTLSMVKGIGPVLLKKVYSLPSFEKLSYEEIGKFIPRVADILSGSNILDVAHQNASKQLDLAEKNNFRIISIADDDYPNLLKETKDDPCILYVKGALFSSPNKSVAIIGTRKPTYHGKLITERITSFFVEKKWSIVSGLAIGCDAIAHETALKLRGHTVAVLAHGLQTIAPARHKELASRILESGGALITEYPFGQEIQKQQYVKRDRIQAGLSRGVVMIQSDIEGGSLHASRASLDYDRWLAVPYPTSEDREKKEPKIQANLIIADGTDYDKTSLFRCQRKKLNNILILNSKNDYQKLLVDDGLMDNSSPEPIIDDMFSSDSIYEKPDESIIERKYAYDSSVEISNNLTELSSNENKLASVFPEKICIANTFDKIGDGDNYKLKEFIYIDGCFDCDFSFIGKLLHKKERNAILSILKNKDDFLLFQYRIKNVEKNIKLISKLELDNDKELSNNTSLRHKILVEDLITQIVRTLSLLDYSHGNDSGYSNKLLVEQINYNLRSFPNSINFIYEDVTLSKDVHIKNNDGINLLHLINDFFEIIRGRFSENDAAIMSISVDQ